MVEGGDNKRIEDEDDLLFRFRNTAALLGSDPKKGGFQELEKEEIYFARPEELNDPMEGLTDVFWQGDDVLWENQIRHYVLTFVWYFGLWFVDNTEPFKPLRMQGGMSREDLPSDTYRTIVDAACSTIFAIPEVQGLPARLSKASFAVRRHGMRTMLMLLHPFVLDAVFQQLFKHGIYPQEMPSMADPSQADSLLQALDRVPSDHGATPDVAEDFAETVGKISTDMNEQMLLITLANGGDRSAKWADLMASFPARYIEAAVRDLHYNPWRTACFSRNCSNASMWGVYADGHRGVALVFRPTLKDERRTLRLSGMLGTGHPGYDFQVAPVEYGSRPAPIDFFLSLGRLPMAKLKDNWFTSGAGETSARWTEVQGDLDAWRERHLANSPARRSWKHDDWAHEEEERLVASTPFNDDPAEAPLKYEFSQLEAIVFGMRSSMEDKQHILRIVREKCLAAGRKHFRFFQADYSAPKGKMVLSEMRLLKFEGDAGGVGNE